MFARVRLITRDAQDALVAARAGARAAGRRAVRVPVVDGKAVRTKVERRPAPRRQGRDRQRASPSGDIVVTAGQLKLRDGVPVTVAGAGNGARAGRGAARRRRSAPRRRRRRKADSAPAPRAEVLSRREAAMQLPEICIKRPVFATVLSLIILLIGLISYTRLSVREYPRIDEPVVSVYGDLSRRLRRGRRVAGDEAARGFARRHRGRRGDDVAEPVGDAAGSTSASR